MVGIVGDKLQILSLSEGYCVYESPSDLATTTIDRAFLSAQKHRVAVIPHPLNRYLQKPNEWHEFIGWKYMHRYTGNYALDRSHCFFRAIREHCSGSNYVYKSNPPNFVEINLEAYTTRSYLQ